MARKRKLQFNIRVLLLLTLMTGTFAAGYRSGYKQRPQNQFANFDELMRLIQSTTVPDTWESLGGASTMSSYPQNITYCPSTGDAELEDVVDLSIGDEP